MANTLRITAASHNKGKWYALFLALLPIISIYRFPLLQMGISTVLIAIGLIPATIVILKNIKNIRYSLVWLLSLYLVYVAIKSDGINILLPLAILIHITAISTGAANGALLRKLVESITGIAALCVILQQLSHLLVGVHISMINVNWVLEAIYDDYADSIVKGTGLESIYRPSAFFLEPAAFAQYGIYGLGSMLFREKPHLKMAILASIGIFATTSGMGFVLTFFMWGWWIVAYRMKTSKSRLLPTIIGWSIGAVVLFFVLMQIPFFQNIVARFTNDGSSDYNAIDGRLFFWASVFGDKSLGDLVWGFGEAALEKGYYYTGFMKILYAYGIIGCGFFYFFWLYLLLKTPRNAKAFVIMYIVLSFFANQVGFISLIFCIGFILTMCEYRTGSGVVTKRTGRVIN